MVDITIDKLEKYYQFGRTENIDIHTRRKTSPQGDEEKNHIKIDLYVLFRQITGETFLEYQRLQPENIESIILFGEIFPENYLIREERRKKKTHGTNRNQHLFLQ